MRFLSKRLLSLDVFRGITIAAMVLVNSPGNRTAYAPLEHAEWNGCTPTDLIFPFFVFILGVSLVFSFSKRGETSRSFSWPVVRRAATIFGLGLFLNGFPYYHLDTIRIPGVLQRIALCYFFAAVLHLRFRARALAAITTALLAGYWLAMTSAHDLTPAGNLAARLDRFFLSGHMYTADYDPEGILSTLPAVATALLGVLTGRWLMAGGKIDGLFGLGALLLVGGAVWGKWFPINKALWTSSYVLFTGGAALLSFAVCYWLIEIRGWRGWGNFFEVFGVNAIAVYVLSLLDLKIQNRIPVVMPDGTAGNLRLLITNRLFESWASAPMASLLYASCHTLLWFFILRELYRRNVFIKV